MSDAAELGQTAAEGDLKYAVGFPDRWKLFHERNAKFLEVFPALVGTCKKILNRHVPIKSVGHDVVFLLGRTTMEDYFELWVMSGNGYGIGAFKILRGLYEKVVTAGYLVNNPKEIPKFVDYSIIQRRRLFNIVKEHPEMRESVSAEAFAQVEAEYQRIKDVFKQVPCEQCGNVKQLSWTNLDTYSLSKKAGFDLHKLYAHGFVLPTHRIHTSFMDLLERKQRNSDGTYSFNAEAQDQYADGALVTATSLLLIALLIQDKYFTLGLEAEIVQRQIEFVQAYGIPVEYPLRPVKKKRSAKANRSPKKPKSKTKR